MDNKYDFPVEERKILTVDGLEVPRKAIIRTDTNEVLSVVGEDYRLVRHNEVLEDIEKSIPTELTNKRISLCRNGAILFARYETPKIENVEVKKGDIVKFGIEIFNSYDGTMPVGFMFTALRLVCTNGTTIPKSIARLCVRHTGNMQLTGVKEQFTKRLPLYLNTAKKWREWTNILPDEQTIETFLKTSLGERLQKQLFDEYRSQGDKSLWGLYNVLTAYNTHNIRVHKSNIANTRLAQFNFEQKTLNRFYNYKWN